MKKRGALTQANSPPLLIPQAGERALITGQTGSGKTGFAVWLLTRLEQSPVVIYDTKEEPKFSALKNSVIVESVGEVQEQIDKAEVDYIIFRPPVHYTADPAKLDALLIVHYHNWRNVACYIDEVYQFHNQGKAGNGLVGLLTRGRSRGITVIMSSQRPAWLSLFAITEAQRFYLFRMQYKPDRKKIAEVIPNFADLKAPPDFGFYFYRQGAETPTLYGPVKLEDGTEQGYIDSSASDASEASSKVIWV